MKIDRVILCLNANTTYVGFWNRVSKVWRLLFKVKPTLIFVGTEEQVRDLGLSDRYGEIHILPPDPVISNNTFTWDVTWGLFYGASMFPDDVCMTCGIDQIPLGSSMFWDEVAKVDDDKFVVGFGRAYGHDEWYPSSHLVAKGKKFKEIFNLTSDFRSEVKKVEEWGVNHCGIAWGLDELYSGHILKHHPDTVFLEIFNDWRGARIDRSGKKEYDMEKLTNYEYSELHAPRPYEEHREYLDTIIESILKEVTEFPQEF